MIVEVMAHEFDRVWWTGFRHRLARRFEQQEIVVRALPIEQI